MPPAFTGLAVIRRSAPASGEQGEAAFAAGAYTFEQGVVGGLEHIASFRGAQHSA